VVNAESNAAKRFHGAWRYVGATVDGKPRGDRGANAKGIIYYDPSGAMSVQVAPGRERSYSPPSTASGGGKGGGSEPTPEEAKAALTGYVAYFGSYTVDDEAHTVTHHRQGSVQ